MNDTFSLTSRIEKNTLIIETNGYINNQGGEEIAQECYKNIDNGTKTIVLDVENSQVVNSIGISILLEILDKLENMGGQLIFANMSSAIEKTLTIMGIFKYAEKANTVEEALNS
jgi:anti-anti-sigma factor